MNPPTGGAAPEELAAVSPFYYPPDAPRAPAEPDVDWSQILNEPSVVVNGGQPAVGQRHVVAAKPCAVRLVPRRQSAEIAALPTTLPTGLATPIVPGLATTHQQLAPSRQFDATIDAQVRSAAVVVGCVPTAPCAPNLRSTMANVELSLEPDVRDLPRTAVAPVQLAASTVEEEEEVSQLGPLTRQDQTSGSEVASNSSKQEVPVGPPLPRNSSSSKLHKRFLEATARSSFASRRFGRSMDAPGGAVEPRMVSLIPEDVEVGSVKLVPAHAERMRRFKPVDADAHYSSSDQEPQGRRPKRYSKKMGRQSPRLQPVPQLVYPGSGGSDDEYDSKGRLRRPKSRASLHSVYDERDDYWMSRGGGGGADRMVRSLSRMSDHDYVEEYDRRAAHRGRYRPKSAQPELWDSQNSSDEDGERDRQQRHQVRTKRTGYQDPRIGALFQIPAWRQYLNEHWRQYGFYPTYEQLQYYSMAQKQSTTAQPVQPYGSNLPVGGLRLSPHVPEPYLYNCAHSVARFGMGGHLIVLGEPRTAKAPSSVVEVRNIRSVIGDMKLLGDCKTMETFPGPLDPCQTAKDTVLQYCTKRLEQLRRTSEHRDHQNMLLLLQFFILMIRQNGMVNGKDLAQMLLQSGGSQQDVVDDDHKRRDVDQAATDSDSDFVIPLRVDTNGSKTVSTRGVQTVNMAERQFTRLLLWGYKEEALDWAIKSQLWGHALFLAMKINRQTHMTVMTRFANSVPIDSPLQTLYQMLSGGVPYSSTRLPQNDESWMEWRSHLAMILANLTMHDEQLLQRELYGVLIMGNTLMNVGQTYGAQFCYICCQLLANWNIFESTSGGDGQSALVTLLGMDSAIDQLLTVDQHVFNYLLTELLEYAIALQWLHSKNCCFWILPLQRHKMRYAVLLSELGFAAEAYAYCRVLAKGVAYHAALQGGHVDDDDDQQFVAQLYEFALKHRRFSQDVGDSLDNNAGGGWWTVPEWLDQLRKTTSSGQAKPTASASESTVVVNDERVQCQMPTATTTTAHHRSSSSIDSFVDHQNAKFGQEKILIKPEDASSSNVASATMAAETSSTTTMLIEAQDDGCPPPPPVAVEQHTFAAYSTASSRRQSDGGLVSFESVERSACVVTEAAAAAVVAQHHRPQPEDKTTTHRADGATGGGGQYDKGGPEVDQRQSRSWIGKTMGGLIQKFMPKGPNEMILPDDSQKSIVWDKEKERWVDVTGPDQAAAEELAPPPAFAPSHVAPAAFAAPAACSLQARRYVSVACTAATAPTDQAELLVPPTTTVAPPQLEYASQPAQGYWLPTVDHSATGDASVVSPFTDCAQQQQQSDMASPDPAGVPFLDPSAYGHG